MVDHPAMSDVDITRLSPALGAEVRGVALAGADQPLVDRITTLLNEHMVLFFPDQHLSVDDHVALGRLFGELEAHPHLKNAFTDHPEIFELAASKGGIADEWHTDLTFQEEPSRMSILNMVECPEVGGDTMWTNLCLAWDELAPPLQEMCEGLTALHDAHPHNRPDKMAIHPVVRIHPDTGKKVLYVNEHFTRRIVELSHVESEALLSLLTSWVHQERFTVRYHWTRGTIAIWDNRCTQHHVLNDFVGERIIQRVTITGDVPEGSAPRWEPRIGPPSATTRFDRQLAGFLRDGSA
jgi:taurine dioxygenase